MLALIFDSAGIGEWLVLAAVAIVVVGPRRLPAAAREFGKYYAKFRRASEGFRRQLMELDAEIERTENGVEKKLEGAFKIEGDEAGAKPFLEA